MNATELIEVVKTLNLNLNSDTLAETVAILAPYYKWYLLAGIGNTAMVAGAVVVTVVVIFNLVIKFAPKAGD